LGLADDVTDANGETVLSFAEAQRKALDASQELKPRDQRRYTVAQAVADYMEHLKVRAKSWSETESKFKAHVLPTLGTRQLSELTTEMIRRWRDGLARTTHSRGRRKKGEVPETPPVDEADQRRRRQATANRVFNALRACLNYAWRDGKVASDSAWRRVPSFRNVDLPVVRFLTEDEARRLINASDPEFRPLARAALLTGCRYGELVALKAGDFDGENATLAIRQAKGGRPRHVYLTAEGVGLFEELTAGRPADTRIFSHSDGSPWEKSHQHRRMREACERARIVPRVSFHVLRHSYASLLTKAGVPLQVVASALGHSDARMTEKHYAHLAPSHVAQLIRDNLPQFGEVPRKVRRLTE
jgi:integrase